MDSSPGEEFAAFEAGFARAAAAAGGAISRHFEIGKCRVEIRVAGRALEQPLLTAFRHQTCGAPHTPDLVIDAWDTQSTGVPLGDHVGELERHRSRGMPSAAAEDGVYAAYLRPDSGLSMLNLRDNHGIYWLPSAERTPFEDRSGPFRGILNWWMSHHERQFIHAAAVGDDQGAVLVVGPSGSGKSTAALSCMLAGMTYLGDDYCLLEPGDPQLVHSLYLSAKLHAGHLANFPELRNAIVNPLRLSFEKGVLDLNLIPGVRVGRSLPIRAVLVPRVTHRPDTEVVAVGRAAALTALAPSTILQLASAREDAMRRMGELVRSVPAFELRAGTALPQIPAVIRQLLGSLNAVAVK